MKKKKTCRRHIIPVIITGTLIILTLLIFPKNLYAAGNAATSSHGYYMYYAVGNDLYRMNTKTGANKKIRKISQVSKIYDISYYKGYLYFTGDTYVGTDGSECYICRTKKNGKGFQKLGPGYKAKVYNNRIYYVKASIYTDEGGSSQTETVGINRMKLNGKGKKSIASISGSDPRIADLEIVGGKVYYVRISGSEGMLYRCGPDRDSYTGLYPALSMKSDGTAIYYTTAYSVYEFKNGKVRHVYNLKREHDEPRTVLLGARAGWIYMSDYRLDGAASFYRYNPETKAEKIISGYDVRELSVGKGKAMVVWQMLPWDGQYNHACSRISKTGKLRKNIKKYYVS